MGSDAGRPLSATEIAVVETNAVALGTSIDTLMERAAQAVAEEAVRHLPPHPAPVAIVAGTGNNGGDGTGAAYYLKEWGFAPSIWMVRDPAQIRSAAARRCYDRAAARLPIHGGAPSAAELRPFPLIVDAMLGTGQRPPLRPPYADAAAALTASRVPVLSVDEPTGVGTPEGVAPTWTVTLGYPKSDLVDRPAGEVTVRDIGLPAEAWGRTGPGEFHFLASRGRKTRSARVVIVGGGPYSGAPALAARAALRSGAERATVVCPGQVAERVQTFGPDLVVHGVGGAQFAEPDAEAVVQFVAGARPRAIVLGMGVGTAPGTLGAMASLIRAWAGKIPLVIDADALGVAGPAVGPNDRAAPVVLTPNAGEFARHFGGPAEPGVGDRVAPARAASERHRVTLVVKGDPDLITEGTTVFENHHHPPELTVAGAGDVLGGVLGSLLAQGIGATAAGRLGTYWVGEAGVRVAAAKGAGLIASDVVEELPATMVAGVGRVRRPSD